MFTVEWLKSGEVIDRAFFLGAGISGVLRGAWSDSARVETESNLSPDAIRVTDNVMQQVTTCKIRVPSSTSWMRKQLCG